MKHAFSRLITFINHLFANVVSTFVERWLCKHAHSYVILSDDGSIIEKVKGSATFIIDGGKETIYIRHRGR